MEPLLWYRLNYIQKSLDGILKWTLNQLYCLVMQNSRICCMMWLCMRARIPAVSQHCIPKQIPNQNIYITDYPPVYFQRKYRESSLPYYHTITKCCLNRKWMKKLCVFSVTMKVYLLCNKILQISEAKVEQNGRSSINKLELWLFCPMPPLGD